MESGGCEGRQENLPCSQEETWSEKRPRRLVLSWQPLLQMPLSALQPHTQPSVRPWLSGPQSQPNPKPWADGKGLGIGNGVFVQLLGKRRESQIKVTDRNYTGRVCLRTF